MLKLEGLKLTPEEKEAALHRKAARLLRIPEEDVLSVQVLRRSIDAREELHLVYTVAPGRVACLRRWCWPDAACAPSCWSGGGTPPPARGTWRHSGAPAC